MTDSYAILSINDMPHKLFDDMESAREYVETHKRINRENASILWPIRTASVDEIPENLREP